MTALTDRDRQLLEQACATPRDWQTLKKLISTPDEEALPQVVEKFYEQVDQSDFSLADWVEALLCFDQWLEEQNISQRPLTSILGYIHCCTLTLADTLAPPNLALITGEMLKQHGFDATSDASPDVDA
ncbi:MAG: hypothetical protein GXP30_09190 [Verrucomicrobia bacterium]|nr:hypothetical protein [Verrucomicrobiota bacterium]